MTLDQQIKEVIEAATQQLSGQLRERLQSLAGEVGQAATAERVSAVRELRMAAEAEIAKRSQEAVAATHAEHSRRLEEAVAAARNEGARRIEEAIAATRAEHARKLEDGVAAARAELTRDRETTLMSLRAEQGRRVDEAVAAARAEHAKLVEETTRNHQAAIEALRAEAARTLAQSVARARSEGEERVAQAVGAARDDAARTLAAVRDEATRSQAEAEERLAQSVAAAHHEAAQLAERSLVDARAMERQAELAQVERIADGLRRLDAGRSLTDVLDVLIDASSKEAPRVAVLVVRGQKLFGWRVLGFGPEIDPRRIEVSVAESGLVGRAMRAAAAVATGDAKAGESNATPFGPLPADCAGLAMPVRVGGEIVAVMYADDAGVSQREVPSAWPEVVEILARHAARCLEVLTVARVAQPSHPAPEPPQAPRYAPQARSHQAGASADDEDAARRYAKLLVSEIKLYHESAVNQGRRDRNLLDRLRSEIERARRLYDERVPAAIRSKTDYFGQELVRTLANGDAALLGSA
ncbi:MAG: hypothetical protein NTY02_18060 [Acidobacteria bacterium]|nr:hypothetical protein [Acidobacteriota bacterium]